MTRKLFLLFFLGFCVPAFGQVADRQGSRLAKGDKTLSSQPPRSVDLRPRFKEFKLGVRQQGSRGACQVFALLAVAEFQLARDGKAETLSPQFLMWAANEANGLNRTDGFNPDFLIKGLQKFGVCKEELMPYVSKNKPINPPSAAAKKDAATRKKVSVTSIKHWKSDIGFGEQELRKIIDHLARQTPVTVTLCWPSGLADDEIVDDDYFLIDRNIDGKNKSGHGVVLVGYELNEKVPGGGYFLFRNSWGIGFAEKGYAKVSFALARKYGIDAYIVTIQ
jgi:hypothetical protein